MLGHFAAAPSAGNGIPPIQHFQKFWSDSHSVILNRAEAASFFCASGERDLASLWIVGDTVAD